MDIIKALNDNIFSIIFTIAALIWIANMVWTTIKGWKTRKYWNEYYREQSNNYRDDSRQ